MLWDLFDDAKVRAAAPDLQKDRKIFERFYIFVGAGVDQNIIARLSFARVRAEVVDSDVSSRVISGNVRFAFDE